MFSIAERARFDAKWIPEPNTGCHLWIGCTAKTGARYGKVKIRKRGVLAHRLAWILAHGPIPDGMNVLHRCDTPQCVNVDHAFVGTQLDNVRDMMSKGRGGWLSGSEHRERRRPEGYARGEANGSSRLTSESVIEIRALHVKGVSGRSIATQLRVDKTTIQKVLRGISWKSVP